MQASAGRGAAAAGLWRRPAGCLGCISQAQPAGMVAAAGRARAAACRAGAAGSGTASATAAGEAAAGEPALHTQAPALMRAARPYDPPPSSSRGTPLLPCAALGSPGGTACTGSRAWRCACCACWRGRGIRLAVWGRLRAPAATMQPRLCCPCTGNGHATSLPARLGAAHGHARFMLVCESCSACAQVLSRPNGRHCSAPAG